MKILKELIPYVIIILIVVIIRTFIMTPVLVSGASMYPTLEDKQVLLLKKYVKKYKRFDIVVIKNDREKIIKRVIGLPGERVEYRDGKLYINNEEVSDKYASDTSDFSLTEKFNVDVIPEDTYFVLGDNRVNSIDSRIIGLIPQNRIHGLTTIRIFPFSDFGKIEK